MPKTIKQQQQQSSGRVRLTGRPWQLCLHRTSAAASENNVPKVSFQQDDDLLPFLENTMNCSIAIVLSLARAIEYCYRYDKRLKLFPKQSSTTRLFFC
jgi:hypothetical protein